MTQEEKAKAYDEALERARQFSEHPLLEDSGNIVEYIFPELNKESEDERIRKDLIGFFKDGEFLYHKKEEIVEWLEKQGEQKPIEKVDNAVEPKFKVGDWITDGEAVFHITSYSIDYGYQLETPKGTSFHFSNETVEKKYHLWSIEDAKDGDVLVDEDVNVIGIFEGIEGMCWHSYIYLGCNNRLYGFNIGGSHMQNNTKPATKEQRDQLEKAMADVGYEWDTEKKELKKIEHII